MKIGIIGTGYVGTVAGACFAEAGNEVICVDQNPEKVARLSAGDPIIYEPGLNLLLMRNRRRDRIRFSTSIQDAVDFADLLFMTVGTPPQDDGSADLTQLEAAIRSVGRAMRNSKIIVNKSTVPVGTARRVAAWIREETDLECEVVSNPEFLREGSAIEDFLKAERVVIGTTDRVTFTTLKRLYGPFVSQEQRILQMDPTSAELTKYACNAFLATRISFMNDLSLLCERTGGDIESIRVAMGMDLRIGPQFLSAGMGYGGSCFPKDIRALLSTASHHQLALKVVSAVEEVNETQKRVLFPRILAHLGQARAGKRVALWGLAFKPNTDDVREAPALALAQDLLNCGIEVAAYDPVAMANARGVIGSGISFFEDKYAALENADALVISTEWDEFLHPDFKKMRLLMRSRAIFDGRNALDPEAVLAEGFSYAGIGRGTRLNESAPVSASPFLEGLKTWPSLTPSSGDLKV